MCERPIHGQCQDEVSVNVKFKVEVKVNVIFKSFKTEERSRRVNYGHGKYQGIIVKLKVIVRVKGQCRGLRQGQKKGQSQSPSQESKFRSDPDTN